MHVPNRQAATVRARGWQAEYVIVEGNGPARPLEHRWQCDIEGKLAPVQANRSKPILAYTLSPLLDFIVIRAREHVPGNQIFRTRNELPIPRNDQKQFDAQPCFSGKVVAPWGHRIQHDLWIHHRFQTTADQRECVSLSDLAQQPWPVRKQNLERVGVDMHLVLRQHLPARQPEVECVYRQEPVHDPIPNRTYVHYPGQARSTPCFPPLSR